MDYVMGVVFLALLHQWRWLNTWPHTINGRMEDTLWSSTGYIAGWSGPIYIKVICLVLYPEIFRWKIPNSGFFFQFAYLSGEPWSNFRGCKIKAENPPKSCQEWREALSQLPACGKDGKLSRRLGGFWLRLGKGVSCEGALEWLGEAVVSGSWKWVISEDITHIY